MEKIVEERIRKREEVIKLAKQFVDCASKYLKIKKAILFGSYVRGDFNEWSDIDILIIVDEIDEINPIKRIEKVMDCLMKYSSVEIVILTVKEYKEKKLKNNPIIIECEEIGIELTESK